MDSKVIIFLGLIALAACNDLQVGSDEGQQIFGKKEEKGWAMSTQDDNVTVTANGTEVITGINVTDLRPAKDGEAKIVDGGLGHKNVTINLKSPGPFRGYDFDFKVYAASEEEYDDKKHDPNMHKQLPVTEAKNGVSSTKVPPANLAKDIAVNKREASVQSQSTAAPKVVSTDGVQTSVKNVDTKTTGTVSSTEAITTSTVKPKSASESDGAKTNEHRGNEDREKSGEGIVKLADHMQVSVRETAGAPTLAKNVNV